MPIHRETIIPEVLSALVYEDQVSFDSGGNAATAPPSPAWVFASQGLESAGQRELVLAILQTNQGRNPQDPFDLFASIYDSAGSGHLLNDGSFFDIQNASPDFDPRVDGFVCLNLAVSVPSRPTLDPDIYKRRPMLLLPLLPEEIQAGDLFGISRVVALLAKYARCHPFPWWHDPRRQPVVASGASPSILAQLGVPPAHTPRVEVILAGTRLNVVVPREDCSQLHEIVTTSQGDVALLTGVAAETAARFVWEPGQPGPSATVRGDCASHGDQSMHFPLDAEVAGNFLILAHGLSGDEAVICEDGFSVTIAESTWRLIVAALQAQEPFTWRTEGPHINEVTLNVSESGYLSPFGVRYEVEDGTFHPYRPRKSPADEAAPLTRELHNVNLDYIRLLSEQDKFSQAASVQALSQYLNEACAVIDSVMAGVTHDLEEACVEFRLAPGSPPSVRLAVRPGDSQAFPSETGQLLVATLNALPSPAVTRHELRFEARLTFPARQREPAQPAAESAPALTSEVDQREPSVRRRRALRSPGRSR